MTRTIRTLAVIAMASLALVACDKKDEAAAGDKAKAAGDKAKAAVKTAGDKAGEAAKSATQAALKAPAPAATADAAMNQLMDGINKKNAAAIWNFLPASYQKDVNALVQDFGGKIDAEMYDKAFAMLAKVTTILKTKKDFLLKNPMVAGALKNPGVPPEMVTKNWDAVVTMLDTIAKSELNKAANLKGLDLGKFAAGTGGKLMTQGFDLAKAAGQDPAAAMAGFKAELVKTEGDKATVKLTPPGGGTAKDEQFVKVEGKWIPQEMADDWKKTMAEAKGELAGVPAEMTKAKAMAMPMMTQVDGALDKLAAAKTQAEFDAAVMGAVASMGGPGAK